MKTTRRNALTLLGSTALVASCAPTIVSRDDRDPFEGGIGGTGIVGTLYGFGSLLINGLRVSLGGRTTYRTPYGDIGADGLAPGQVLTVSATRTADGIVAGDVMVDYVVVGTLRMVNGRQVVNGVPVIATPGAVGHARVGMRVAVSGTWTANGVRPSRFDLADGMADLISGTVTTLPDGQRGIGGVAITNADDLPTPGSFAAVLGQAEDGLFRADEVQSSRFARARNLRLLSVEGFLEPAPNAPGFRIAGLGHNFARDVRLSAVGAQRAVYFGRYDGLFGANRGYIVPNDLNARSRLLSTEVAVGFDGQVIRL